MEIVLAILAPPLAVHHCGRPVRQTALSFLLWMAGIVPGVVHALWVVGQHHAQQRSRRQPQLGRPNPFGSA